MAALLPWTRALYRTASLQPAAAAFVSYTRQSMATVVDLHNPRAYSVSTAMHSDADNHFCGSTRNFNDLREFHIMPAAQDI